MGDAASSRVHAHARPRLLKTVRAVLNVESGAVLLRATRVRDVDGVNESGAVLGREVVHRRDAGGGRLAVARATLPSLRVFSHRVGVNGRYGRNQSEHNKDSEGACVSGHTSVVPRCGYKWVGFLLDVRR